MEVDHTLMSLGQKVTDRRSLVRCCLTLLLLMVMPEEALSAWPTSNLPVCLASNKQMKTGCATDGSGGSYVVWQDYRKDPNVNYSDIYAMRLTAAGTPAPGWPTDGAPVCTTAAGIQNYDPVLVGDGNGGIIVAFFSARGSPHGGMYAQRLDSSGAPQWTNNGVLLSGTAGYPASDHAITPDGSGGAFVAWQDNRIDSAKVFAQHITSAGVLQWSSDGIPACSAQISAILPSVAADNAGGIVVAWTGWRGLLAQRVNSAGDRMWGSSGIQVSTSPYSQIPTRNAGVASDDAGGAYIGWDDNDASDSSNVFVQHLAASGVVSPSWPVYGVRVSPDPSPTHFQASPKLCADGTGGVVLTFRESRNLGARAQRVGFDGTLLWGPVGVAPFGTNMVKFHATVPDSSGGFVIAGVYDQVLRAQRLNAAGIPQWAPGGVVLSSFASNKSDVAGAPDGAHGAIFAWADDRNESAAGYYGGDIYAQNVNANGSLGGDIVSTQLALASVTALPDRVSLRWFAGAADIASARLDRSLDGLTWLTLGTATAEGSGYLAYEDGQIQPGARYAYRLAVRSRSGEEVTATTWVDVPTALRLSFEGPWPQPVDDGLMLRITVANRSAAKLRILDVQGRVVAQLLDGMIEPGQHTLRWSLDGSRIPRLPNGVFFARLEIQGRTLNRRVVIAR